VRRRISRCVATGRRDAIVRRRIRRCIATGPRAKDAIVQRHVRRCVARLRSGGATGRTPSSGAASAGASRGFAPGAAPRTAASASASRPESRAKNAIVRRRVRRCVARLRSGCRAKDRRVCQCVATRKPRQGRHRPAPRPPVRREASLRVPRQGPPRPPVRRDQKAVPRTPSCGAASADASRASRGFAPGAARCDVHVR
jgi:hypothetical protein